MNKRLLGFSLVELMVAMVVALVTVYAIFQVFGGYEGQKRVTVGIGNAESNGKNALYLLERDIRQAGFGLTNSATANCLYIYGNSTTFAQTYSPIPATIVDPNTTSSPRLPVSIYVRYGSSVVGGATTAVTIPMPNPSAEINVSSTNDIMVNDIVLGVTGNQCAVMQITHVQATPGKIQHDPNSGTINPASGNFVSGSSGAPASFPGLVAGDSIVDLGQAPDVTQYSIQYSSASGQGSAQDPVLQLLQLSGPNASATATPLIDNIISVQAQYGVAQPNVNQNNVVCWTNAVDNSSNNTAAPCDQNWSSSTLTPVLAKQIKAIRIAILARSPIPAKPQSNGQCTATSVMPYLPWPDGSSYDQFDVSENGAITNWKCYRYKVFSTVIPLRNVLWANM
ncbi:MAG: PilW family protein [Betaproteobacteria bacterium]|nr:PilW family protein [Betaproteobacteria bacterium]